jgi:Domain of unknown function (DUF4365)
VNVTMHGWQQERDGSVGESEVMAAFQRLGWGPMSNRQHDRGSDLFVLVRDERGDEANTMVGLQVKAGSSYFKKPTTASDPPGWWYYDSKRSRVEAWAAHAVPHLVVLHDLNTKVSYWAHVMPEAIVETGRDGKTGKGVKILVPAANTVDVVHREALLAVAATIRSRVAWEGSAWAGAASLVPRDLLRHALIVPRVIAPHPNAGTATPLTPEQAVALLVNGRTDDIGGFATAHAAVPSLTEAKESPEWRWRFVGALGRRVASGEVDELLSAVADAPDAATRAAATVTAASALVEEGNADEAVALLETALGHDDAGPVDHAWLKTQHARACVELGRIREARSDALAVQEIRLTAPDDVTASAMAGAAVALLFNTSWGRHDDQIEPAVEEGGSAAVAREAETTSKGLVPPVSIGQVEASNSQSIGAVIEGADTAATWWRTQTTSWGLNALADRTFNSWAQDKTGTVGAPDEVNDKLRAAALTASHLGDQGGWCHQASLLGRDRLLQLDRHVDPELARQGLNTLRLAGDERALKLAVQHLVADGPASAVTLAAADVRLDAATRTTAPSDLALLQHGGDLLDEETVDRAVEWLLAALKDPTSFVRRTSALYAVEFRLVETLAAIAAHPNAQRTLVDHVIALPSQQDQMMAISWARVVRALPDEAWNAETARRAGQNADAHRVELRMAMLSAAARHDGDARALLTNEVRGGSLYALSAIGDVRELSTEDVATQIDSLAEQAKHQIHAAQAGSFGMGSHDVGSDLALLNAWHPDAAKWPPLLDLLTHDAVAIHDKRGALQTLASLAAQLPDDIKAQLRPIAMGIADRTSPPPVSVFDDERDLVGEAANLAVALGPPDPNWSTRILLDLLSGRPDHRYWAVLIARRLKRPQDIGVLVSLTQDPDPDVRAGAAAGLASLVATESEDSLVASALQQCLRDPGRKVPATIAVVLADAGDHGPVAHQALNELRGHPSAFVRAMAARAVA